MKNKRLQSAIAKFWCASGTMIFILFLTLMISGCASGSATTNRVVPKPIILTEAEQDVLRSKLPNFYIRFTNQQKDILEARK